MFTSDVLSPSLRTVYSFEGPTIVYCRKKATTEDITRVLKSEWMILSLPPSVCVCVCISGLGISCDTYHADISLSKRKEVHHKFLRDELQVHTTPCTPFLSLSLPPCSV